MTAEDVKQASSPAAAADKGTAAEERPAAKTRSPRHKGSWTTVRGRTVHWEPRYAEGGRG